MRRRLLDLFCGAGGAAMGYHRAGFTEIVGVDIKPQPRYPFEFHRLNAMDVLALMADGVVPWGVSRDRRPFDAIHASPPCQKHSAMTRGRWQDRINDHDEPIEPTRELLKLIGVPYVIENVIGAPLIRPVLLCGTMFGLGTPEGSQLRRHRLFECSWPFGLTPPCQHNDGNAIGVYGGGQHPGRRYHKRPATIGVWGKPGGSSTRDELDHYGIDARKQAMGIDWMKWDELSQAIPPAYTEFIGRQLLAVLAEAA